MPALFSRSTLLEACNLLAGCFNYHGEVEDLFYRWGLDEFAENSAGSMIQRFRQVFRLLKDEPETMHDGRYLVELVVERAAMCVGRRDGAAFVRALERDGFSVERGVVRRTLPDVLDLPAADDEVHVLLERHGMTTSLGHLDQAIRAHSEGHWAAANGQLRTFYEALFDEISPLLDAASSGLKPGETRRQRLANMTPPFLSRELNEWSDDGKNFVNGVFKRLHPQGSHPGLSDEEDCTFRLHLTLLVARLFLRRLDGRAE
jgi:hypothetical protein